MSQDLFFILIFMGGIYVYNNIGLGIGIALTMVPSHFLNQNGLPFGWKY